MQCARLLRSCSCIRLSCKSDAEFLVHEGLHTSKCILSNGCFQHIVFCDDHEQVDAKAECLSTPGQPGIAYICHLTFDAKRCNLFCFLQVDAVSTGVSGSSGQDPEPTWVARHPLKLRSAYSEVTGSEPPYTTCHSKFLGTVDYMWYTPNVSMLC